MKIEELAEMVRLHRLWILGDKEGKRADLSCADLRCADLSSANLSSANLSSANLSSANLSSANLSSADLRCADLRCANLRCADLRCANLRCADLSSADLRCADLSSAKINWSSHEILARILFLAAGDDVQKRMVAGLIALSTDWCWKDFLRIEHREREWALVELRKWLQADETHPVLRPTLTPIPKE